MVTDLAIRKPPFASRQSVFNEAYFQALAVAEWTELQRSNDGYMIMVDPDVPRIFFSQNGEFKVPAFGRVGFPVERMQRLLGFTESPAQLKMLAFRVLSLCNPSGCEYFPPGVTEAGDMDAN